VNKSWNGGKSKAKNSFRKEFFHELSPSMPIWGLNHLRVFAKYSWLQFHLHSRHNQADNVTLPPFNFAINGTGKKG